MAAGKCYDNVPELLSRLFSSAVQSLWIATAFLDSCGASLMREAISRGVSVRLLVPSDVGPDVLRGLEGAEIRIYSGEFMHMKLYIADGKAYGGSANLTCNVLRGINIETLCEVDPESAVKIFNSYWAKASPYIPEAIKQIPKCLVEVKDLGDSISFKNPFEGYELTVYRSMPYSVLLSPAARRMVHMAPQMLTTSFLKYILPPSKSRSVDVGSIASLWASYSANAKELGHEDLSEEDRVRVNKIFSILSSTVKSLESSLESSMIKQAEGEARKISDIIASKVKELAGRDVEVRQSPPWLSLHYWIAENILTIPITLHISVYIDSEDEKLVEDLASRVSKAVEEIKATAKSYVDKMLEDASKTAREILQGVRRCGIASKARVNLTLSLYIDGHSYEYNLGETTL